MPGSFFVLDPGNRRVQAFSPERKYVTSWGGFGPDPGQFRDRVSLAVDADFDELVSAGTLGLMTALKSFDPQRGLAFSTFAVPRIRGSILDELRRQDHVPRSVRRKHLAVGEPEPACTAGDDDAEAGYVETRGNVHGHCPPVISFGGRAYRAAGEPSSSNDVPTLQRLMAGEPIDTPTTATPATSGRIEIEPHEGGLEDLLRRL
jgi:RNA polymerase sigma factor (sigma-70 family)